MQDVTRKSDQSARNKALDVAWKSIQKDFGQGALMKLGQEAEQDLDAISTGILPLDIALGVGGIPRGRVVEIYGPESSGKTTVALHIVAEAQKGGGNAAFIDAEHALDPVYAKRLGVNIDDLIVAQPDNGEQALEITEALVRSGALDVIVIDSVAALVPQAEIDGVMGEASVGLHARLMSQALRKLTPVVSKSETAVIFINQIREKIGVSFGNPETTTGGRALKFFASIRIDVRGGKAIKQGDEFIGRKMTIKVVKNKVAPPFKGASVDLIFGEGVPNSGCILDLAVECDIVKKSGSWYSYKDAKIGQGRDKARMYLEENEETMAEIDQAVRDYVLAQHGEVHLSAEDDDALDEADEEMMADDFAEDLVNEEADLEEEDIDILGLDEV